MLYAFVWTSTADGQNMHGNVVFKAKAPNGKC
jgi:hypothetical protein